VASSWHHLFVWHRLLCRCIKVSLLLLYVVVVSVFSCCCWCFPCFNRPISPCRCTTYAWQSLNGLYLEHFCNVFILNGRHSCSKFPIAVNGALSNKSRRALSWCLFLNCWWHKLAAVIVIVLDISCWYRFRLPCISNWRHSVHLSLSWCNFGGFLR